MKNRSSLLTLKSSLKTFALIGLCASSWQFALANPPSTPKVIEKNVSKKVPKNVPYKALSAHDAAWYKAHPHYKPSPKRGWIKTLPHRYRIVKQNNQTYYYAHGHYYHRSGFGYVVVKIPFISR